VNFYWDLVNRNKKSVALDIRHSLGREVVHRLVKQADVFISNIRPATLKRLGYDYETLSGLNPRLIYAYANSFGTNGKDAERKGMDETAFWARGGIMSILGDPGTPVSILRGAMGDLTTSMFLATGIGMALYERSKTGLGQRVDSSLYGSAIWVNGFDIQATLSSGQESLRTSRKARRNPFNNAYQTKDERWIQLAITDFEKHRLAIFQALGREGLKDDPRFGSRAAIYEHNQDLIAILDEIFEGRTLAEWVDRLGRLDVAWSPAYTIGEIVEDPQAWENEFLIEAQDESGESRKLVAVPVKLRGTPGKVHSFGPELGQHTEEVLLELGYTWEQITDLKNAQVIIG
jgi:crotonobetainyl-CoA:carnitine CoA-transferase CaiB-like acyl-CoA transferase